MITRLCRTPGCTHHALNDRAVCNACRNRTYRSTARPPEPEVVDSAIRDRLPVSGLCLTDCQRISRTLTALDLSAEEIGRIVGRTPRTIYRWRAADRAASPLTHAEAADLDGQGVRPVALHTATTVPTGSYL